MKSSTQSLQGRLTTKPLIKSLKKVSQPFSYKPNPIQRTFRLTYQQSACVYLFVLLEPELAYKGLIVWKEHCGLVSKTENYSVPQHRGQLDPHRLARGRRRTPLRPHSPRNLVYQLRAPANQNSNPHT